MNNPLPKTGRPRGAVDKSVKVARKAIAEFIELNTPRFSGWLEQVADGIPVYGGDGQPVKDAKGATVWLVKPDPATAIKLVADLTEYHLPKLTRTEAHVVAQIDAMPITDLPTAVLQQRLFHALGLTPEDAATIIEGEAMPVKPEG